MNAISCLIPAEGTAATCRPQLEQRLRDNHANQRDGAPVDITWRLIEPGSMFTAGSPSTSAVIACTMDGPTTLLERETYLRAICDFWTDITGCTDHEIVVSITEINDLSTPETETSS